LFVCRLHYCIVEEVERRVAEERAKVEAEYRKVLETSVQFERRIKNRWREKSREKNRRIAELEERVAELERRTGKGEAPGTQETL
jgi:hypothetical protein